MSDEGPRYGPLVSALGAAALGISVFLPWYSVTLTQGGVESARQTLGAVAQQYGNQTLRSAAGEVSAKFGALAGHQLGTLSAHDVLKDLSIVFLILAAVGLVAALLNLAGAARTGRGQIALVGLVAGLGVVFRMIDPPAPPEAVIALSLEWGAWLALIGSIAMIAGDLWARPGEREPSTKDFSKVLEELSGWTPET
ncbi:MAG TPA: hypothetical protein VMB91_02135 [Solirubrobacteraceae bacterium]|nr:hypothetical protein [Solirubrobacteraceae bacterium]